MTPRVLQGGPSARGWSEQGALEACPQRWAWAVLAGERGKTSPALQRGALVHTGLQHYWQREIDLRAGVTPDYAEPVQAVALDAAMQDAHDHAAGIAPTWQDHVPLAQKAVQLYMDRRPHAHLHPLAAELQQVLWFDRGRVVDPPPDAFERYTLAQQRRISPDHVRQFYAMGAPWLSTFRVDLLASHGGMAYAVDWKTAWKVDDVKKNGFVLSGQMLQHDLWGRIAYGAQWGGVQIGFVNFAAVEGGKGAPFLLHPVPFAPGAEARFGQAVCDRAERIAALLRDNRHLDNFPRAFTEQGPCTDRYSTCDYWRKCCET